MRKLLILLFLSYSIQSVAQFEFAASPNNPFGKLNPLAPPETAEFKDLIGKCECKSVSRINQNEWADTVSMTWIFKYIMNGFGVQDETLKQDGVHSGSIRQFNQDSSKWYVHYYSSNSPIPKLSTWAGGKQEDKIILYRTQAAPNGMDGFYRLTFADISNDGFNWVGEWVDLSETIVYPTWKIYCRKTVDDGL